MVQDGLRVVAMDLVLAMIQAARSYGRKKGLLGSYVVGNAVSLPFCDACFDGVAMLGAIIAHVPGRDGRVQAFRAAWRTLRRSEEHTSELQSRPHLVCRLLLEKKKRRTWPLTRFTLVIITNT